MRIAIPRLRWRRLVLVTVLLAGAAPGGARESAAAPDHRTATFSMYCYWTGEATLGRVPGVLASRIGHWGGNEIVQVDYDPRQTDLSELVEALRRQRSFYAVVVDRETGVSALPGVAGDDLLRLAGRPRFIRPKHSLRTRHPELAALDLSESQAMALNSWSYFGGPMPDVLTDEQKRRLAEP